MRIANMFVLLTAMVMLSGCVSFRIGTDTAPPAFKLSLPGSAYADYPGVPKYDGTIMRASLFRGGEYSGELFSLNIWPIGGIDLGLIGARLNLLGGEVGLGTLFYAPEPIKMESE